jgi:hypothetical protein
VDWGWLAHTNNVVPRPRTAAVKDRHRRQLGVGVGLAITTRLLNAATSTMSVAHGGMASLPKQPHDSAPTSIWIDA